ncbi:MAG: hypothetical protein KF878_23855 [Planctomycetes bacterium]|nr:hypothetical protein [Planctomycetota bacterium]
MDLEALSEEQVLAHWKRAAGDTSAEPWGCAEALGAYFQWFRPDGFGVERALLGLAQGPELLERVRRLFRATAPGDDLRGAYFSVRQPERVTEDVLLVAAQDHINRMIDVARTQDDPQLAATLARSRPTIRRRSSLATAESPSDLDLQVYERAVDWVAELASVPRTHALLLREPAYLIACDPHLRDWLLWPVFASLSPVDDPFEPYAALWLLGCSLRFEADAGLVVEAPTQP